MRSNAIAPSTHSQSKWGFEGGRDGTERHLDGASAAHRPGAICEGASACAMPMKEERTLISAAQTPPLRPYAPIHLHPTLARPHPRPARPIPPAPITCQQLPLVPLPYGLAFPGRLVPYAKHEDQPSRTDERRENTHQRTRPRPRPALRDTMRTGVHLLRGDLSPPLYARRGMNESAHARRGFKADERGVARARRRRSPGIGAQVRSVRPPRRLARRDANELVHARQGIEAESRVGLRCVRALGARSRRRRVRDVRNSRVVSPPSSPPSTSTSYTPEDRSLSMCSRRDPLQWRGVAGGVESAMARWCAHRACCIGGP